jgi:DNA-binding GntR family transcriptional regulator
LLRAAILRGELPAGHITTQGTLAERLGVGRTPLREALRMLQSEGLIVAERNRQVQIASLSADDAEQLYIERITLETVAIRLTVPTLTSDAFAELEGAMAKMDHYMSSGDQPGMRAPHRLFHHILVAGAGARVSRDISELHDHAERYRLRYGTDPSWEQRRQEHRAILTAAAAVEPDEAAEALAAHYVSTARLIVAALDPDLDLARLRAVLRTVAPRTVALLR